MSPARRAESTAGADGTLHTGLLTRLGADLSAGAISPGDVLSMEQLESRYGVSRTVVREAVKVLESVGVLTSRRRVGLTLRPEEEWEALSPLVIGWRLEGPRRLEQLREISELRSGIEPVAAALAARRATPEQVAALRAAVTGMSVTGPAGDLAAYLAHDVDFHTALLAASGNAALASMSGLVAQALAGRTDHHLMPHIPREEAVTWHVEVAVAIGAGDAPRAEAGMRAIVDEAQAAMEDVEKDIEEHVEGHVKGHPA